MGKWKVQVFGHKLGKKWEISVIHESFELGHRSWGWFTNRKLLISHNGGPCDWPLIEMVWDAHMVTAQQLCDRLNAGEQIKGVDNS